MRWRAFLELAGSLGKLALQPPSVPPPAVAGPSEWRILALSRGRLRLAPPSGVREQPNFDEELRRLPGVSHIEFDTLTTNLLFLFDPDKTSPHVLLDRLRLLQPPPPPPAEPPVVEFPVVSASRGRLRVHLTRRLGARWRFLAEELRRVEGVRHVDHTFLTGNLLILFDPEETCSEVLLDKLRALRALPEPPANGEREQGRTARIPVRGMDRSPRLAREVIQGLERKHGVRARAKMLTGHLLVEYDHHRVLLEDIIATVAHLELPELPEEDRPTHPLDPEPLVHGSVKAVGTLLGMSVLTIRRLAAGGTTVGANGIGVAATTSGLINLLHGFPFVRNSLREWLGHTTADALSNAIGVIALTVADFPLGLIVIGVETLIFLGEVTARRSAWSRYEDHLDGAASAEPGAVIRLEAGMQVPHAGRVIEGMGTATARSGLPMPLSPGSIAPAGAVVSGGPFVLELRGGESFEPEPRPGPPAKSLYQRYHAFIGPASLAFAAFTGVRTASLFRAFEALLLLNPRTAAIGLEAANLGAAARILRGGLTVVGTRPERVIELPDVVLLDGPRLLTDGLEIAGVVPLGGVTEPDLVTLAAGINHASGSPWGMCLPPQGVRPGRRRLLQRPVGRGDRRRRQLHPGAARRRPAAVGGLSPGTPGRLPAGVAHRREDDHFAGPPRPCVRASPPAAAALFDRCRAMGVDVELLTRPGPLPPPPSPAAPHAGRPGSATAWTPSAPGNSKARSSP